jgi:hypothetical protein
MSPACVHAHQLLPFLASRGPHQTEPKREARCFWSAPAFGHGSSKKAEKVACLLGLRASALPTRPAEVGRLFIGLHVREQSAQIGRF